MIALLEPIFQGDWRPYGDSLSCGPAPDGALAVTRLLADDALLDMLVRRYARHLGTDDMRPATSSWSNAYLEALLPPVAAAATILHHVFPATAAAMMLTLDEHGAATAFHPNDFGGKESCHVPYEIDRGNIINVKKPLQ